MLASIDGKKIGLIPANYVKVLGKKRGSRYNQIVQQQTPGVAETPASIPQEVSLPQGQGQCCKSKSVEQPDASPFVQDTGMESVFQGLMDNQQQVNQTAEMNAEDILGENTNDL